MPCQFRLISHYFRRKNVIELKLFVFKGWIDTKALLSSAVAIQKPVEDNGNIKYKYQ